MAIVVSARRDGTRSGRGFGTVGRGLALSGLVLVAAGCDLNPVPPLVPGIATEADVRARYGVPEIIWEETDGTREYQYRSLGDHTETRRIVFGPGGRLHGEENALAPERLAKVGPGWRIDDVRRWLGQPSESMFFVLSDTRLWRWRIRDRHGAAAWFEAVFDANGTLLERSQVPEAPDADSV